MIKKRMLGTLIVTLAAAGTLQAAEMSVSSMLMPPGATATLEINGDLVGESTFGLTIMAELVPQAGAVGTLEFTAEPPLDIVQLGDPWPGVGTFSPFDTLGTGFLVLNGVVDDNGTFLPETTTFSGALAGFPVIASAGASGVWDVFLTTDIGPSEWAGELVTTLIPGTITVVPTACVIDLDCDDSNECTSEVCTLGICTNPNLVDGTACTDDGNECSDDICTAGLCSHPPLTAGTSCGNPVAEGLCDNPDTCDGAGICTINREPGTTVCSASTDECDPEELCDGTSPFCPADLLTPDGTVCTADGNECTIDECSAGVCSHPAELDGILCIDDGNECTADVCSLGSCSHPALTDGTVCTDDGNDCSDDVCTAGNCSHPPLIAGTSCGNPIPEGFCDNPDTCDGAGTCAVNREPGTTVCNASTDECDPEELCDGASAFCPVDVITPDGTACTDDGNECSDDLCGAGVCLHPNLLDGTACTDDGIECRDDECQAGVCSHPFTAVGTACGNQTPEGICDNPDICDGAGACSINREQVTTVCNASTDECDPAEFCDGASPICPVDALTPDGTVCTDDGNECTIDECSVGVCSHPNEVDGTLCLDEGNVCTDDSCSGGVCQHLDNTDLCDDNDPCTENDTCSAAVCAGSAIPDCQNCLFDIECDDLNDCTDNFCLAGVCSFPNRSVGAPCGDPIPDDCDDADSCDGAGVCLPNFKPAATECRPTTGECDPAEFCTGSDGACPGQVFLPDLTPCTDDTNDCTADVCNAGSCIHPTLAIGTLCGDTTSLGGCDNPDTCDGAGVCLVNLVPVGTECRATTDECDPAEFCDGAIDGMCPTDQFVVDDTVCTDEGNDCTTDVCTSGLCSHPFIAAGTPCGDPSLSVCDNPDSCDGLGVCLGNFAPDTTECRSVADVCDSAEFCTGDTAACPPDGFLNATTVCRGVAGPCDARERCTGSSAACPADTFAPNTIKCRAKVDLCDADEFCTGIGAACPADLVESITTECRPAAGLCDVPDFCDGVSDTCGVDLVETAATVCRAPADVCDIEELCDGVSVDCPADSFEPATTLCRPAGGVCDVDDFCTGDTASCSADAKSTSFLPCRPAPGVCDIAEFCDGINNDCPTDVTEPSSLMCGPSGGICDISEFCTGADADCPSDQKVAAGTECRAIAGLCDVAESCTGSDALCPSNTYVTGGTECRGAVGDCDPAELCSGVGPGCPADELLPDGSVCTQGGSDCTNDTCQAGQCINAAYIGACCLPGSCGDGVPSTNCEALGGTCLGPDTVCGGIRACCLPDGSCDDTLDATCCEALGGVAHGAGAICLGDLSVPPDGIDNLCQQAAFAPCELEQLSSSTTGSGDNFGAAVGISGDLAIVGAPQDDNAGSNSGAAFVFRREGVVWLEEAELSPTDAAPGIQLGVDVAIDGGLALVGAWLDSTAATSAGAAYVFRREGISWVEEAQLFSDDIAQADFFGAALSLKGDLAIIGATGDDDAGSSSGAAYVFRRFGTSWQQEQKLVADVATTADLFGDVVAIGNGLVIVGAPGDDDGGSAAGATYVFRRDALSWVQEAKLVADDAQAGDEFGVSVTIDGNTVAIGARLEDDRGNNAGAVYVFTRSGTSWLSPPIKITAFDGEGSDQFGISVSLKNDLLLVGATGDDDAAIGAGASYLYSLQGGAWVFEEKLTASTAATSDLLGEGALSVDSAIIGAGRADSLGSNSGTAFIFALTGPDCDENAVVDACEMRASADRDCDGNGILDTCEPTFVDTDNDTIADACDTCPGVDDTVDDDNDGVADCIDNCNLKNPLQEDCEPNGIGDICDLANCAGDPACGDCNDNGVPDECDIASLGSQDSNGNGIPDECEECQIGADCDDGVGCTVDSCNNGSCFNTPNPAACDDGDPCTDDSCNLTQGCRHVFNAQTCPCQTPLVFGAGSRYLAIRPQPANLTTSAELLVTSPSFSCLSKFVGHLACGQGGDACQSDADCNACTGTSQPCLTTADCKTCSDQDIFPCVTNSDCNPGATCEIIQTCTVSGLFCEAATTLPTFDLDADGIIDGTLGTLLDDPADALSLTPAEWTGNAQAHCSLTKFQCVSNADCNAGRCLLADGRPSGPACSVLAQDCESGLPCQVAEICIIPAVYVTGRDIVPSELINEVKVDTLYEVQAQCGALTVPASVVMPVWADTADANDLINATDLAFLTLVIQQRYDAALGRTLVAADLTNAAKPCETDQLVGAADLQRLLKAFQRETYTDQITSTSGQTGCSMPCP